MASKIPAALQKIAPTNNMACNIIGLLPTVAKVPVHSKTGEKISNPLFCDSLTGLPNKRSLFDRLGHALSESLSSKLYGALLVLDLNNFKSLNDTGPDCRDELVVEIAKRVLFCVRGEDIVARLGGDEFAVLFENISPDEEETSQNIARIADKIQAALDAPFQLDNFIYRSSPSIGISLFGANTIRSMKFNHC